MDNSQVLFVKVWQAEGFCTEFTVDLLLFMESENMGVESVLGG
jgi:hypothetical protein